MCQAEDKVLLSGRLQFGWETVHNKVLRKPDSVSEKDTAEEGKEGGVGTGKQFQGEGQQVQRP